MNHRLLFDKRAYDELPAQKVVEIISLACQALSRKIQASAKRVKERTEK